MYFHPAFAARNAVTAVELAELGAYASENILEGEAGLFAAFRRQPAPQHHRPVRRRAAGDPERLQQAGAGLQFRADGVPGGAACGGPPGRGPCQGARHPGARASCGDALSGLRLRRAVPARAAGQDEHPVRGGRRPAAQGHRRGELPAPRRRRHPAPHLAHLAGGGRDVHAALSGDARRGGARQPCRWLAVMDRLDDVVPATSDEIRARFRAAAAAVVGPARARRDRGVRRWPGGRSRRRPGGGAVQRRSHRGRHAKAAAEKRPGGAGHDRADGRELSAGAGRRPARSAPSTA